MMDVHFVTGVKGGAGKTMFSRALIDFLRSQKKVPLSVIEADRANSDIYDVHVPQDRQTEDGSEYQAEDGLVVNMFRLGDSDGSDGWVAMVDHLFSRPTYTAVINAGAQNIEAIELAATVGFLGAFRTKLKRRCITWWLVTEHPATVDLLADYMAIVKKSEAQMGPIHVVLNHGSGDLGDFSFYIENVQKEVLAGGGREVVLPTLDPFVVRIIEGQNVELSVVPRKLTVGRRIVYDNWRNRVFRSLAEVIC